MQENGGLTARALFVHFSPPLRAGLWLVDPDALLKNLRILVRLLRCDSPPEALVPIDAPTLGLYISRPYMNYKDTLNLPKTEFPMKADLVRREPEMLARWESEGLYHRIQTARRDCPAFIMHDGPPFANGDVHMGTALNKVLKDIIVKSRTMSGFRAPFIPGWDCHGLPIEFKVVKESADLHPVQVRTRSEAYARKFIDIQRRQFKRLGVLADWENPYLTLTPQYEAAILRAFATFLEKGLVYQSRKPVLWSTGAQTALAEAEVEYADRCDPAIMVKFPAVSGPFSNTGSFVIWTTTPWTLPANTGIALHPRQTYHLCEVQHDGVTDQVLIAAALQGAFSQQTGLEVQRVTATYLGSELVGTEARHPFLDRTSRVINAEFVTMDTGTGQVHIAPGHGADDYTAGMANGLPLLSPVDDRGCFTADNGMPEWTGRYVFDANASVVDLLRSRGALFNEEPYTHSYPHCWRSKTPVVFRAVEQLFIRIDALRDDALSAIDQVRWLPHWGRNRIHGTVESRPDWCVSRQRTWGVPVPVFYDGDGVPRLDAGIARKVAAMVEEHGTNLWFEKDDAWWAEQLGLPPGTSRRTDTLDVWIDSGVSHQAVVKQHPDLQFPADVYIEATDQHRGWFQSSLMTSIALHGVAPYKTVITHGFVVDKDGRKISKSSSYEKPMDAEHFVNKYGADILRLWVSSVNYTDEVPFSEEMFTRLADTYRRIRNTFRILLANLGDFDPSLHSVTRESLTFVDRWILARTHGLIRACTDAYEAYEFHKVHHAINHFCAVDLSSLYVDITKDRMYCDAPDSPRRRAAQTAMRHVLEALLPLTAPILSFTAEEAWQHLGQPASVHLEQFPKAPSEWEDEETLARFDQLMHLRSEITSAVEKARQQKSIGNALEADVILTVPDDALRSWLESHQQEVEEFFILSNLKVESASAAGAQLARTEAARCDRCWRHRVSVGTHSEHPELCDRCVDVVISLATNTP